MDSLPPRRRGGGPASDARTGGSSRTAEPLQPGRSWGLTGSPAAAHADVMGDAPAQQDLSDLPVACPVCGLVHERCVFTGGSLCWVRPGCRNPHHRETPPAPTTVSRPCLASL